MTDPTADEMVALKRGRHYEARGDTVLDSDGNMTFRVTQLAHSGIVSEQVAIAVAEALTGAVQPAGDWRAEHTRHSIEQLRRAGLSPPAADAGEVREKVAANLCAWQNDMTNGEWPAEHVAGILGYISSEHTGDCTKEPWSCMRCQAEEIYKQTDQLLALLAPADIAQVAPGFREGVRPYPDLLSDDEQKALLARAERLWAGLQANDLGGFSGINRPFWIMHEFKRVIEAFGRRDVGLSWSKDDLDNALPDPAQAVGSE